MTKGSVVTLLTGQAMPLAGTKHQSGIVKSPVTGRVKIGIEGISGDEQADRRVHGGPEKALHHYPHDHYPTWQAEIGRAESLAAPGAFGENISSSGMTENDVAIGDIFRLGSAVIQVSQGRQPCWKLNHRFGVTDMARRVQNSGRSGWYYRILEPGEAISGDRLILIERIAPEWTIHRLWQIMYIERMNLPALAEMASLDVLAEGWRKYARRRLESGQVEDWSKRLEGS